MKHTRNIVVATLMGLAVAGSVFAYDGRQGGYGGYGRRGWGPPRMYGAPGTGAPLGRAEVVTVSGPLQLVNGRIAVVQDGNTYYADRLGRLTGFIEGLREGAQVTLTGVPEPYPSGTDTYRLWISAMTLNGKVYDGLDTGHSPFWGR